MKIFSTEAIAIRREIFKLWNTPYGTEVAWIVQWISSIRRLNFHFPHLSTFVNIQNPSKESITKIHPTTIPQMKPQNLKKNHPVNIGIAIKRNVASHVMNTRPMLIA